MQTAGKPKQNQSPNPSIHVSTDPDTIPGYLISKAIHPACPQQGVALLP